MVKIVAHLLKITKGLYLSLKLFNILKLEPMASVKRNDFDYSSNDIIITLLTIQERK